MLKYIFLSAIVIVAVSCRIMPNSDKTSAEYDPTRVYQLRLNPPTGSKYQYDISNRSNYKFEVEDKKIANLSKVNASMLYTLDKDTTGDFVFHIQYDKIHVYTKNDDAESDLDAANAANSIDPVEKLLGGLKDANIVAKISPAGEVLSVSGFREMYNKYVNPASASNAFQSNIVKQRWDNLIGEEMINKNMEQLFRIFPDSAVRVGDKWKLSSRQKGEIALNTSNSFTLKGIQDQTAFLESEGAITSDSVAQFMNNTVSSNLKGNQKGEFQVDMKTGILLNAKVEVTVQGTLQVIGREVPLTISSQMKMNRHQ